MSDPMDITIAWDADTDVIAAPGRPGAYCPAAFRAEWSDGARIHIAFTPGTLVTSDWYLPAGLEGQTTREAWRERIGKAIDGACWAIEQLTPAEVSQRAAHSVLVAGRPSRIRVTDDLLRQVADIVREAERPHVEVAEALGLSQPNASQRIHEARRRGLLEPSERGVATPA